MAATVFRRSHLTTVEILDLRHFSSADLRSLLEEEVETWRNLLCWDYRSSADMILRYVDAKILPGYAAVERGSIIGYSFFVYEGSKGVVGDLFVSPRRGDARQVEAQMAEHVIETLQQSPGIHRVEAQLLTHPTDDLAGVFSSAGFQRYRRLFLELQMRHGEARRIPPMGLTHDIVIRPLAGAGLPTRGQRHYRLVPHPHRFRDQRPVPHPCRLNTFPEQHCAFPRLWRLRCGVFVRGDSPSNQCAGGIDSVLAREG